MERPRPIDEGAAQNEEVAHASKRIRFNSAFIESEVAIASTSKHVYMRVKQPERGRNKRQAQRGGEAVVRLLKVTRKILVRTELRNH